MRNVVLQFIPLKEDKTRFEKLLESNIYVYGKSNIVGFCAFYENEIRALFVEPESRGKGLGQEMFEFMLNLIQGKPFLYVARSNIQAKSLYKKYGFIVINEFETQYNCIEVIANQMKKIG